MKRYALVVLVVAAAVLLPASSACRLGDIEASLGQQFSLAIGKGAQITGENLEISFKEVIEDSRCARDVICIWEGRVISLLEITQDGTSQEVMLTQPGLTDQHAEETHSGYRFTFGVEPYPEEADKQIKSGEYRLLLTISK
ncbi:MAG: hypothetical protein V3W01_03510 [Dehalococcoidales bacterium]